MPAATNRSRYRDSRGVTLVELMIVMVIIASVGALGASLFQKGGSSSTCPAFARNFMSLVHEARHAAMTSGRAARIRIVPNTSSTTQIISEVLDPADTTKSTWQTNGTINAPLRIQVCQPSTTVNLSTSTTPTCPITTSMNTILCFAANGLVNLTTTGTACSGTGSATASLPSTGTGATLYFKSTIGDFKYRLAVWGLTGLPKLVDTW